MKSNKNAFIINKNACEYCIMQQSVVWPIEQEIKIPSRVLPGHWQYSNQPNQVLLYCFPQI